MSPPMSTPRRGPASPRARRERRRLAARHEGSSREGLVDAHAEHGVARPLVRDPPHGSACGAGAGPAAHERVERLQQQQSEEHESDERSRACDVGVDGGWHVTIHPPEPTSLTYPKYKGSVSQ